MSARVNTTFVVQGTYGRLNNVLIWMAKALILAAQAGGRLQMSDNLTFLSAWPHNSGSLFDAFDFADIQRRYPLQFVATAAIGDVVACCRRSRGQIEGCSCLNAYETYRRNTTLPYTDVLRHLQPSRRVARVLGALPIAGAPYLAVHLRGFEHGCIAWSKRRNMTNGDSFCYMRPDYVLGWRKRLALELAPLVVVTDYQSPGALDALVARGALAMERSDTTTAIGVDFWLLASALYTLANPLSTFSTNACVVRAHQGRAACHFAAEDAPAAAGVDKRAKRPRLTYATEPAATCDS